MHRKSRKQQTVRFLYRSILFLAVFAIALFLFFYYGNTQSFLDSTQKMILFVLSHITVSLLFLSTITLILEVYLSVFQKMRFYLQLAVPTLFYFLIGAAGTFISRVILFLSSGM